MKQRFEVRDYVWFRWYDTSLLAGRIETSFWDGEGVPFYRIQGTSANFNGVLDKMIERKMEAHEIVQHKLMGLFIDEIPVKLSSEAYSPSP